VTGWTWALLTVEWAIRLAMLVYVPIRRTPNAARAWLLLIFLEPIVGILLYLVFGRTYLAGRRIARQEEWIRLLRRARERSSSMASARGDVPDRFAPLVALAERLGDFSPLGGNAIELVSDYEDAIARLIRGIDGARHHVHLLYYIFEPDGTGRAVAEALQRAAARGVSCRVLMDAAGSRPGLRALAPPLQRAGVEVLAAMPRRRGTRFDLRNHRKIAVVDARIGFVGSQNLVEAYDYKGRGLTNEELVAVVQGPAVAQLQAIFLADRSMETGEMLLDPHLFDAPPGPGHVVVQALPSAPSYSMANGERFMVDLMYEARRELVVTTPYFVPDEPFLHAVQAAALRGVEVHLVVPEAVDQRLVRLAQESFYDALLEVGVQIHLYRPRFLHAKHIYVDGEVVLMGSSNFDLRSFGLNEEVSLVVYDDRVAKDLRAVIGRHFAHSRLITREEWARRSFRRKFAQNLARLLDSLL
jgi:cardiolipin synthase